MRTRRGDLEDEAQRALLAEADGAWRRWLAIQDTVAPKLIGEGVEEPLGTPGTTGFLIRYAGECELARQLVAQAMQVDVGPHRGGRAAFHIDDAAAVNSIVGDGATPGVVWPGFDRTGGEDVDMAIEDEVLALAGTVERANHVGPIGLCRAVGDGHALRPQTVVQKSGGNPGIARRIGARFGDEVRQKLHEEAAIAIDPGQQLIVMWRHASILLAPPRLPPARPRQRARDLGLLPERGHGVPLPIMAHCGTLRGHCQ